MTKKKGPKDFQCPTCRKMFRGREGWIAHDDAVHQIKVVTSDSPECKPDWSRRCEVCGQSPIVPITGLCGPCTFGESETYGGNW